MTTNPSPSRPVRRKFSKIEAKVLVVLGILGACVLLSIGRVIVVGVGGGDEPEGGPSGVVSSASAGVVAEETVVPVTTTPAEPTTPAAQQPKPPRKPPVEEPTEEEEPAEDVYYANCAAVRAAGAAPLHRRDPGYRAGLDRDGDGVACER